MNETKYGLYKYNNNILFNDNKLINYKLLDKLLINVNINNKNNELINIGNNILYLNNNEYATENIKNTLLSIDNNINEYDYNIIETIYKSSIDPNYHIILWKLLSCIIKLSKSENNFVYIKSGNSLAYREYNILQFTNDDDIDIGYITDYEYNNFKIFMMNNNIYINYYIQNFLN